MERIEFMGGCNISLGAAKAARSIQRALGQLCDVPEREARFQKAVAAAFEAFGRIAGVEIEGKPGTFRFEPAMLFGLADVLAQFAADQIGGQSFGTSPDECREGWALRCACATGVLPPDFVQTIIAGMESAQADSESHEPRH